MATGTTTRKALRYPTSTSAPNVPQDIQNLATDLDAIGGSRGNGSAFPSNGAVNDTFFHTIFDCNFILDTSGQWRQCSSKRVADTTALTTYIAALASAGLSMHNGFRVFQSDTDQEYISSGGTALRLAYPQDFSNGSVDNNVTATGVAWQGVSFAWDTPLGTKVTIPGDGVTRIVKMIADCNVAGDGWMRIRVQNGGNNYYYPNANGKRTISSASQEQDLTLVGRYQHTGASATTIYLEAKSQTAGSANFLIPVLDITAI